MAGNTNHQWKHQSSRQVKSSQARSRHVSVRSPMCMCMPRDMWVLPRSFTTSTDSLSYLCNDHLDCSPGCTGIFTASNMPAIR
eukprot:1172510-Pyramimonas_sp.AAC.1